MVKWFKRLEGFSWDEANREKNWLKHRVTFRECEEAFGDLEKKLFSDPRHSKVEHRYLLFGKTQAKKYLIIAFTIRKSLVRVISARPMSRKEKAIYEEAVKNSKI